MSAPEEHHDTNPTPDDSALKEEKKTKFSFVIIILAAWELFWSMVLNFYSNLWSALYSELVLLFGPSVLLVSQSIEKVRKQFTYYFITPPKYWTLPVPQHKYMMTRDSLRLSYFVIDSPEPEEDEEEDKKPVKKKVMVFANGLGVRGTFLLYAPIIHHYIKSGEWTFITWNYRGLHGSDTPKNARRLAIPEHAEDLLQLMKQEKLKEIDVLFGHSMGVQVSLEFAILHPEKVRHLVLMNGTHGHVLSTAYQPFFRVPLVSTFLSHLLFFMKKHRLALIEQVNKVYKVVLPVPLRIYSFLFGSELLRELLGPSYYERFLQLYFADLCSSPEHTFNYLRLFEELHAHSVYHLLGELEQKVLVISGLLDVLTPAYQGFELAKSIPHSTHYVSPLSSHCSLLESPEGVLGAIVKFVDNVVQKDKWQARCHLLESQINGVMEL